MSPNFREAVVSRLVGGSITAVWGVRKVRRDEAGSTSGGGATTACVNAGARCGLVLLISGGGAMTNAAKENNLRSETERVAARSGTAGCVCDQATILGS